MALPQKKSRSIIVNGVKFRWAGVGFLHCDEPSREGEVYIELFDNPKQKMKASFAWEEMNAMYKKVNHRLSKYLDMPPPFIIKQTIFYALKNGWQPDKKGGVLDLGNLDKKIDYTLMNPQD
ncbi:hypothetical protein KAR10_02675 [bacterium]|nr:hypothetical protein [bacterium]